MEVADLPPVRVLGYRPQVDCHTPVVDSAGMTRDKSLRQLAECQHGLLSREQIRSSDLTPKQVEGRVGNGTLIPVTPTVVRLSGAPRTQAQRALAAVLEAGEGGCLSHESAAAYWGIPGFRLEPLNVWRVRDRSSHPNRVGLQHKSRRLPDHHLTELDGVRVTTPTRVVFDLAAILPFGKTARVLDNVWVRRLTTWTQLREMFEELRGRGRSGTKHMRILLTERGEAYRPPESNLERRFHKLAFDANVADFDRQVDISGRIL